MILSFVIFAQEASHEEHSPVVFYVIGAVLAVWAVAVSAMGISRSQRFPAGKGGRNGLIGLSALLVVATCASAVLA
jgi:hypothetical protein